MDNTTAHWVRNQVTIPSNRTMEFILLATISVGCIDVSEYNQPPVAIAGDDQEFEYHGTPVTVTLDGSKSYDPDGKIVEYIWYDTGVCPQDRYQFIAPPDFSGEIFDWTNLKEYQGDPANESKPVGQLEEGEYRFTLWVKDDDGSVSIPDSVLVRVGSSGPTIPTSCQSTTEDDEDAGTEGVVHENRWKQVY